MFDPENCSGSTATTTSGPSLLSPRALTPQAAAAGQGPGPPHRGKQRTRPRDPPQIELFRPRVWVMDPGRGQRALTTITTPVSGRPHMPRGSAEADRLDTSWTTRFRRGGRSIPGRMHRAPNSPLPVIPRTEGHGHSDRVSTPVGPDVPEPRPPRSERTYSETRRGRST